jgi:replication initiator protein RepSA
VLWNALAGRLWSRTTIYLYRTLAKAAGMTEAELRRLVRISYAKVAEYQRRGAVHFHAVIRLDARTACGCPACVLPPSEEFTAALLEEAVKEAAATVAVACPAVNEDQGLTLTARWGEQLHIRHITRDDGHDDKRLLAEQVAGYVAKYATKSTEALGVTLDHRICEVELEDLDLPAHVAELVRACWELGGRPSLTSLRLRKWAHMLGFGGHFSSKSRRYSTTLGALRRAGSPMPSAVAVATPCRWMPGAARRTTRPRSSLPPGTSSAWAIRRPGRRGWPPRLRLGLAKRAGSPRRSYEPFDGRHDAEPQGVLAGWRGC